MERMRVMARPSLLDEAFDMPNPMGVWVQVDTWSTHVFVLYAYSEDDAAPFTVCMYSVRQEDKGRMADEDEIVDAIGSGGGVDDESTHASLSDALRHIAGAFAIDFDPADPYGLAAVYDEASERRKAGA